MLETIIANALLVTAPVEYLMENIAPPGTLPGTVVAGTSKSKPDYWYHWTRDAALVMDVLKGDKSLLPLFNDYLALSARHQRTPTLAGLGEPKFNVNGTAFNEPWGRPQNDGPALRALTLTRIALELPKESAEKYYQTIKPDLDYTLLNWNKPSFDLWEEVLGEHFYTKMVQRKALAEGACLAQCLGDAGTANRYLCAVSSLECDILRHFQNGGIVPTLNRTGGIDWKVSGLDSSVILAVLHTQDPEFVPLINDYVINTAHRLKNCFKRIYPINQEAGIAIGRYPEDRYNGIDMDEAHPWFLLTFAFSEYYALLAKAYEKEGEIQVTPLTLPFFQELMPALNAPQKISNDAFQEILHRLNALSWQFYHKALKYAGSEGRMSEQFDRRTGKQRGAENLTWSYANQWRASMALEGSSQLNTPPKTPPLPPSVKP
jgi:glucoamylase